MSDALSPCGLLIDRCWPFAMDGLSVLSAYLQTNRIKSDPCLPDAPSSENLASLCTSPEKPKLLPLALMNNVPSSSDWTGTPCHSNEQFAPAPLALKEAIRATEAVRPSITFCSDKVRLMSDHVIWSTVMPSRRLGLIMRMHFSQQSILEHVLPCHAEIQWEYG